MSESPMIEAVGLQKRYGEQVAVDGVDLEVPAGRILGVLGPNGAGKSTTVRMLTTMTRPDGGTGRVAGLDIVNDARADPPHHRRDRPGRHASTSCSAGRRTCAWSASSRDVGAATPGRRAGELLERVRAHPRRRSHGEDLLGRHAPPPRPGREPR